MGKEILHWLQEEISGRKLVSFVGVCSVATFLLLECTLIIMHFLGISPEPSNNKIQILVWWFPFLLCFLALIEEIIFRLPLVIIIEKWGASKQLLVAVILLSVGFGLAHGSVSNIPLQGVSGFMFSLIFLKCGGLQGRYVKALCASTIAHATINGIIALFLLARGIKTL